MSDYLKIGEIPPSTQDRTFKQWVLMALAGLGIVAAFAVLLFAMYGCGGALCKACAKNPQLDGCAQAYQTGICKAEPTPEPTEPPPTTTTTTTVPPEPDPTPTVPATPVCTLGTPSYRVAYKPSWGITAYGRGYHFSPKAWFGADYCRKIGYTDGRTECAVAPDGHPQRRACEFQFAESTECPIVTMGRCLGTGNQCPVTFDAWIYDATQGKEIPHQINHTAGCSYEGMLPQNGEKIRAQWVQPAGKGTLKVCFDNGWCTESQPFDK